MIRLDFQQADKDSRNGKDDLKVVSWVWLKKSFEPIRLQYSLINYISKKKMNKFDFRHLVIDSRIIKACNILVSCEV